MEPTWFNGEASVQVMPGGDPLAEEKAVATAQRIRDLQALLEKYREFEGGLKEPDNSSWKSAEPSVQIIPDQPAPYGPLTPPVPDNPFAEKRRSAPNKPLTR